MKIETPENPTGREMAMALIQQGGFDPETVYDHPLVKRAFDEEARRIDPDPVATEEKKLQDERYAELLEASAAASAGISRVLDANRQVMTPTEVHDRRVNSR